MLKASALYLVIVMSLVISVICSALIIAAYIYFSQYQAKFRADRLQNNLNSGISILLGTRDTIYQEGRSLRLFDGQDDSVYLQKKPWGVYDVCTVKSYQAKDTLYKVFSVANNIDSAKWGALYLIDEDRPISVSGNTNIRGNVYLPRAGIRPAYVDNEAYTGDKRIVLGETHDSGRKLPPLQEKRINGLVNFFMSLSRAEPAIVKTDSLNISFREPVRIFNWGNQVDTLQNVSLKGNIILYSDTTLVIDSTVSLSNVLVFAKGIVIKKGFHGSCQLFASDSVSVQRDCRLDYPSAIGVIRTRSALSELPEKISIGEHTTVTGTVFSFEKAAHQLPGIIALEKKAEIIGLVYSEGILKLKKDVTVRGGIFTSRFLYQSDFTMFENYLISANFDATALSRYYLTSDLIPSAGKKISILQWIEAK